MTTAQSYEAPSTIEAAVAALARRGSVPLAGGQSVVSALTQRILWPERLVDIGRIPELHRIDVAADHIMIGAGVSIEAFLCAPLDTRLPALAEAMRYVGNRVIRNRATVGGGLAWADPRAELPMMLMAHDASINTSQRSIAADAFMTGAFRTVLADGELILSARIPVPSAIAFQELTARQSNGRATLTVACARVGSDRVRVTIGALVDRPVRSAPLRADTPEIAWSEGCAFFAESLARYPTFEDTISSSYRQRVAPALLRRCLERLGSP